MKRGRFDVSAFFVALDATRIARGKTWKQVATEADISASSLTRMAQGSRPDVDGLAALSVWSGLNSDDYIRDRNRSADPEPLAQMLTCLRADKRLSEEGKIALEEVCKAAYQRLRKD